MTPTELAELGERFGADDPLPARLLQHVRELRGFLIELVEHLDSPGPSPEKTAEHYQITAKARRLRQSFNS